MLPAQIEAELLRLSALLEKQTTEIAKRAQRSAIADSDYKAMHAKCCLKSDAGTMGMREREADVACEGLYRERRIAEALLQSAVEAGRNYRSQLEALRSIMAQTRYEMQNTT